MRRQHSAMKAPKILAVAAAILLSIVYAPQVSNGEDMPGSGIVVTAADDSLIEGRFQTEVVNIGLERLGYEIGPIVNMNVPSMYVALAQGDADFVAVGWQPQNTAVYEKAGGDAAMTQVGTIVTGAAQGFQMDRATAEKLGITNIAQLTDPELAKLFDSDGDGKANLAGCPPGWGCEAVIENHFDQLELRDTITHDQGDFVPIHADVVARYRAGDPVVFYTYVPMWLSQILVPGTDVVWLETPDVPLPYDTSGRSAVTQLPDGRNLGFEIQDIKIVANNEFLAANPAAARFLSLVKIPLQDINAENLLIYEGEDQAEDVRHHAETWIVKNQDLFDSWVAESMNAAQ